LFNSVLPLGSTQVGSSAGCPTFYHPIINDWGKLQGV
jgi:hypothetical protein